MKVLLGDVVVDDDTDEMVVPMLSSASGSKGAVESDAIAGNPEIKLGPAIGNDQSLEDDPDDPDEEDDGYEDDPRDLKIEEVEFMEEDSEKLILVITGDQEDGGALQGGGGGPGPPNSNAAAEDPIGDADIGPTASLDNNAFAAHIGLVKSEGGVDGGGGGGRLVVGGRPGDPDKCVPEPFADVVNGEAVYLCPADCSHYSRQAKDMSKHIR